MKFFWNSHLLILLSCQQKRPWRVKEDLHEVIVKCNNLLFGFQFGNAYRSNDIHHFVFLVDKGMKKHDSIAEGK